MQRSHIRPHPRTLQPLPVNDSSPTDIKCAPFVLDFAFRSAYTLMQEPIIILMNITYLYTLIIKKIYILFVTYIYHSLLLFI